MEIGKRNVLRGRHACDVVLGQITFNIHVGRAAGRFRSGLSGSEAFKVDDIMDPLHEVGFFLRCAIDPIDLHAILVQDKGQRFLDLKALRQIFIRISIDLQDLELSRFSNGTRFS
jgi:hypothetical protein